MRYEKGRFAIGIAKQDQILAIGISAGNSLGPHDIQIWLLFFWIYIEYDFRKDMDEHYK